MNLIRIDISKTGNVNKTSKTSKVRVVNGKTGTIRLKVG